MANRIDAKLASLKKAGRKALVLYITAGFPDVEKSMAIARGIAEAGADIIEIGVPFSDPLADGPTIQRSSFHALHNDVTLDTCLDMLRRLRKGGLDTPIVFMGYFNPLLQYGLEKFAKDASAAGLDGLIVADMPTEEVAPLAKVCSPKSIHIIPLLAPTSTDERIAAACKSAKGFVYCVSLTGVTGARTAFSTNIAPLVDRIRRHTSLPVLIGFGVSTREHVAAVNAVADGVVIGSALINAIEKAKDGQEVKAAVDFVRGLKGK